MLGFSPIEKNNAVFVGLRALPTLLRFVIIVSEALNGVSKHQRTRQQITFFKAAKTFPPCFRAQALKHPPRHRAGLGSGQRGPDEPLFRLYHRRGAGQAHQFGVHRHDLGPSSNGRKISVSFCFTSFICLRKRICSKRADPFFTLSIAFFSQTPEKLQRIVVADQGIAAAFLLQHVGVGFHPHQPAFLGGEAGQAQLMLGDDIMAQAFH